MNGLRLYAACVLALGIGCRPAEDQGTSTVTFGNATPLGTWQTTAGAAAPPPVPEGAPPAQPTAGMGGAAGSAGAGMPAANPPVGTMNNSGTPGSGGVAALGSGGAPGSGGMTGIDQNMNNMGMNMGGTGGAPGSGGSGDAGGNMQMQFELTFDVTTVNQGGRYAPRNVGAIWIETAAGSFVKTLEVWAGTRGRYLSRFNSEAGGSRVDAVTSATLRSYSAHHATWDLTDVSGNDVASGDYKVVIEVTDHDGPGKSANVPFTYGAMPMMMMPSDQQYYTGMSIVVQ